MTDVNQIIHQSISNSANKLKHPYQWILSEFFNSGRWCEWKRRMRECVLFSCKSWILEQCTALEKSAPAMRVSRTANAHSGEWSIYYSLFNFFCQISYLLFFFLFLFFYIFFLSHILFPNHTYKNSLKKKLTIMDALIAF